ncbi:MAG: VWA domain-containing protein [Bacteroidota bacterium]
MKRVLLFCFMLMFITRVSAQYKNEFDLDLNKLKKSGSTSEITSRQYVEFKNELTEATLITGGCFTLGTNKGLSASDLDNNAALGFGHPYAMTSYPLIQIDGNYYKLEELALSRDAVNPINNNDTLIIDASLGVVSASIKIFNSGSESIYTLLLEIENNDSAAHDIGAAIIYDAGFNKWGDAFIQYDNVFPKSEMLIANPDLTPLQLWEKREGAKGMGLKLSFGENKPEELYCLNWNKSKDFSESKNLNIRDLLYDLVLNTYWSEKQLASGEKYTFEMNFDLVNPDFSSPLFTRWDLPQFLSLENNVIFPENISSHLEIANTTGQNISGVSSNFIYPSNFRHSSSAGNFSIAPNSTRYSFVELATDIVYEDAVFEVTAVLEAAGAKLDEITKYIFVPATPISDTGLVVNIDSLNIERYPKVDFVFEVKKEDTDYLISNIAKHNVFLYENSTRITDFSFGKDTTGGVDDVDIVFVLDVTGSMSNEINAVKNNLIEFTDSLSYQGIDFRLGMVTFLDVIENVYDFTRDVQSFQTIISQQYAHGGADTPENSLDALDKASQFEYRPEAKKIIIWITDANYHEKNTHTQLDKQTVINSMLSKEILVHVIGSTVYKSAYYDPFTIATGGSFYNIDGNFRDILLEISRFEVSNRYLISYMSQDPNTQSNIIKLDIRYAGLGGTAVAEYFRTPLAATTNKLSFFPNPFNPEITFRVNKQNYTDGYLRIFNILGELVKEFSIDKNSVNTITWNATNDAGQIVGSGFYLAQIYLTGGSDHYSETAKIIYLK